MSPEQASGNSKHVGQSTDIYSLGAILYRALTGSPPFAGTSPLDTMAQVRWSAPIPLRKLQPSLPIDIETICLKCLNKEPSARYLTASELGIDLRRFLDRKPIRARRTSMFKRLAMRCARRPAITALALLLLLAFLVSGYSVMGQWRLAVASLELSQQRENERSLGLVDALLNATPESASIVLSTIRSERPKILTFIRDRESVLLTRDASSSEDKSMLLNRLRLALVEDEPQRLNDIDAFLVEATPSEFVFLRSELSNLQPKISTAIWKQHLAFLDQIVNDQNSSESSRFHASLAIANSTDPASWKDRSRPVVDYLLASNPLHVPIYYSSLRPPASPIIDELISATADQARSPENRLLAATLLSDAFADQSADLLKLLLVANDEQFSVLVVKLPRLRESLLPQLREVVSESIVPKQSYAELDHQIRRILNAALALFYLEEYDSVWPLFRESDRPDLQTSLTHRMYLVASSSTLILNQIKVEKDVSTRRALLLTLGE